MSIRVRLTLWYTGLLAAILLVLGLSVYSFIRQALLAQVDETIRGQADGVVALFNEENDPLTVLISGRARIPAIDVFATQVYVQIRGRDGRVVQRSTNLGDSSLPGWSEAFRASLAGRSVTFDAHDRNRHLRIHSAPIRLTSGQIIGVVEVGQSLEGLDATLRTLRLALLVGFGAALLLAALVGAFLARTALRPVDEITRTARQIAAGKGSAELGRRISIHQPNDEVGRLASTFNEMLERLERLFQAQQRLVADVSHELRSPLTTLRGNLDLLRRGAIEDPQVREEALAAMEAEAARMSRLLSDLLLLAQADAGVQLQFRPVELDTLLLEVYRQALVMAAGRVQVQLGSEDQALVMGDADRLRQLLLNLVENAIKYTPPGGKVTLSLAREPGWVYVTVADTGIGIAPEDLPHIFERFYRADKARSRAMGGTGLGLSIAQWIAQAHGGQITVESRLGEGS
ncbi:MAG: HAMP domain-containing histidine kinase, partial [Anaerolineae bacterium]|nr:HAMP domain-containing histidine kinase [Anaerolineae bacterium]